MLYLSTLIPTYRRPQDLARCLQALQQQTRFPDEVLLVVRDTDEDTWSFLKSFNIDLPLRTITVTVPGVVAALNAGLEQAQGDIISITDDDAAPHADWLARIEACFLSDDRIGGVGGRDWVYKENQRLEGACERVGLVQGFGRTIGNHHLGVGNPREVDILKGVNMSFRRAAIEGLRFDTRMRGAGAQVHFEMAFSLVLRQAGWKLIYDPAIQVDHYPAQRFDEDQRSQFNEMAFTNAVHNETLALLEYLSPLQRLIFLTWAIGIGTRQAPGIAQGLRFLPSERLLIGRKWLASMKGRWHGWQTWRQHQTDSHRLCSPTVFYKR